MRGFINYFGFFMKVISIPNSTHVIISGEIDSAAFRSFKAPVGSTVQFHAATFRGQPVQTQMFTNDNFEPRGFVMEGYSLASLHMDNVGSLEYEDGSNQQLTLFGNHGDNNEDNGGGCLGENSCFVKFCGFWCE